MAREAHVDPPLMKHSVHPRRPGEDFALDDRLGDPAAARRVLAGIRVLLVDDDADIRDAFQLLLEAHGAEVRPVASAAAALAALETWTPDVLLTDISMPVQDGYDLIHLARPVAPPAAALTANATREGQAAALAAGFRMYLGKPIDSTALVAAVAALARDR
jgi:two-component system, chemotaxis family, CheB/CheR fusion protein